MKILEKIKTGATMAKEADWLRIMLVAVAVVLGALYIWQVNARATNGFAMRDLEGNIATLQIENERLYTEVSKLQSIDSVSTRVQMLGLVRAENVNFVDSGSAVAIR